MQKKHSTIWVLVILSLLIFSPVARADEQPQADGGRQAGAAESAAKNTGPEVNSLETAVPAEQAAAKQETFQQVDLDLFIEQEKLSAEKGKRMIKMARPVSFDALMKRPPEEREVSYVYTALELSGVSPLPEIHHRMFVESNGGRIIPVYVEKKAVEKIDAGLKTDEKMRFLGYHVYSYAKGPALLVVDYTSIP